MRLGRYEFTDDRSNKYWEACYDRRTKEFAVFWGRIGAKPQIQQNLSYDEVNKRINEKTAKGYVYTGPPFSCHEVEPHRYGGDDTPSETYEAKMRMEKKRGERAEVASKAMDFMKELKKI